MIHESSAASTELGGATQHIAAAARLMADTAKAAADASRELDQTIVFMKDMDASGAKRLRSSR